ncbi:MAG: hypothetical protein AAGD05_00595 [Bacteroidota bacterium]
MVVCDHQVERQAIQTQLKAVGLQDLFFSLTHPLKSTQQLLKTLRALVKKPIEKSTYDPSVFQLALRQCLRYHQRLEQHYQALKSQRFGEDHWSETVGRFMRSNREEGKELLRSQLKPHDFAFDFAEYEKLQDAVFESQPRYQQLGTFQHPLQELKATIFLEDSSAKAHQFVETQTQHFLQQARLLQHRYIHKTDEYAERLHEHYESHHRDLLRLLRELEEGIEDGISQFGHEFADAGLLQDSKRRVYGLFYDKYKNLLGARAHVSQVYQQLKHTFERTKYFDFQFSLNVEGKNIRALQQHINQFKTTLTQWRKSLSHTLQEELHRLSNKTVHPSIDYDAQIEDLEYALDLLVEELNESGLYEAPHQNKMLTIPMRQQYLEDIIEQLERTLYNMRDFAVFYQWQHHWLSLDPSSQKLIHALIKIKPANWLAAFESWYFHNRLQQDYQISLAQNDQLFQRFIQAYEALQNLLPKQIIDLWQKQQQTSLRRLRKRHKAQYQTLFPKATPPVKQQRFNQIWTHCAELLTAFFPVLVTDLATAVQLAQQSPAAFDLLLFNEHASFSFQATHPTLALAPRQVLLTNPHLELGTHHPTLLQYFRANQASTIILQNQHRSVAEPIHRFNQTILFHQQNSLATATTGDGLTLVALESHYDEQSGVNRGEAEEVIRQLHKIKKNEAHLYPQITVACSTLEQRDAISNLILEMRQRKTMGHDKMQALLDRGLEVCQVAELAGAKPEVLFFSLTYAYNANGDRLCSELDFYQTEAGQVAYYLMATRPSQQLTLIHSLPMDILQYYLLRPREGALSMLARQIHYIQAFEKGDPIRQRQLLQELYPLSQAQQKTSIFIQELARALQAYLEDGRIVLHAAIENLKLPLLIKPLQEQAPPFVIQVDGFFSDADSGAYLWENTLRKKLIMLGLEYYPIWSVNWWKAPKQEARKLASIIIKKDALSGLENQAQ